MIMNKYSEVSGCMRTFTLIRLVMLIGIMQAFFACNSDDIGGNLYTATDQTMSQYLEAHSEFSDFSKVLDYTGLKSLLNSYGAFTCFAPDSAAMHSYYHSKFGTNFNKLEDFNFKDSLTLATFKKMALDHIVNGYAVKFADFSTGQLSQQSMSERYFRISFNANGNALINDSSMITVKDITVHNGIIQRINKVLQPSSMGILQKVKQDSLFTIFTSALEVTGLQDSINKPDKYTNYNASDWAYLMNSRPATSPISDTRYFIPSSKKYGFTVLMESNATFAKYGVTNLDQLRNLAHLIYGDEDDNTYNNLQNRNNSLNRFIAYHLINKRLSYDQFINRYDNGHAVTQDVNGFINMYEYIETMLPNTLIEVVKDHSTNKMYFNRVNSTDNLYINKNYSDKGDVVNGVYHEVTDLLVYNDAVNAMISNKRLRFDVASFFPEMTNYNMRGPSTTPEASNLWIRYIIPPTYMDRLSIKGNQTLFLYSTAINPLLDYQGDEFFISPPSGQLYDFTMTTPAIPAGSYEVRFGFQATPKRGVCQFYFDGEPCGVPVNLSIGGTNPLIGYEKPGSNTDDPNGYQNDKAMRTKGFMKGPASFKAVSSGFSYSTVSARVEAGYLRRILGTYNFAEAGSHKIRITGLSGGQFVIDFVEFVPTSLLESEDIY